MGDTIVFDVPLPAKIALTTYAELIISADVSIDGPGEDLLALDGNGGVGVFDIAAGRVKISNLTIQNGLAPGDDSPAAAAFATALH